MDQTSSVFNHCLRQLASSALASTGGILVAACMVSFVYAGAPTVQLGSLDGSNGFRLDGVSAGDGSGSSVAGAGDVNGDGIGDLIIGASRSDSNGPDAGSSYVVFGRISGLVASMDLSTLDGNNGFRLVGSATHEESGYSVAGAGDINGDGIDDLVIGAPFADWNGYSTGSTYAVFGRDSFPANIDLASLDGSDGFRMDGAAGLYFSGGSVAGAGDVNGDGVNDLVIGGVYPYQKGDYPGRPYVVFGHVGAFAASLDLGTLNGNNGFVLDGVEATAQGRFAVAGAGDLNADGIDDLVIGSSLARPNGPASGSAYVVFGSSDPFPSSVDLNALDGHSGFRVDGVASGQFAGLSVAGAGDINGDGIDDLAIGRTGDGTLAGSSYVLFGHTSSFPASLSLDMFDGSVGFRLDGVASVDYSGYSLSGRGDINNDGLADLLIGAHGADPNGQWSGSSYVFYGHTGGFPESLSLDALNGNNGFRLDGEAEGDSSGISVAHAGDVSGDGVDDLIVGAPNASPNSVGVGSAYVVYGLGDRLFCEGFDGITLP